MPRKSPKCRVCGEHPRSKIHKESCGGAAPEAKEENLFIIGSTCLPCKTTYTQTPFPLYQEPTAKIGKYDVTRQLPNNSARYPVCANCLPDFWRLNAARYDMVKECKETYG